MKCLAIIPARGGSKRIPRKNLQKIGGRTLLEIAVDKCLQAGLETYVSTEDDEIGHSTTACWIHRPEHLAADDASTYDVIADAVKDLECDWVFTVQCTHPFIRPIRFLEVQQALDDRWDSVVTSIQTPAQFHPKYLKIPTYDGSSLQFAFTGYFAGATYYSSHGVIATKRAVVLGSSLFGKRICNIVINRHEAWDIDDPMDLEVARAMAWRWRHE